MKNKFKFKYILTFSEVFIKLCFKSTRVSWTNQCPVKARFFFQKWECKLLPKQMLKDNFFLFITMTFSQSLNILSSNCVISVDRNCVLLLLFFLPTLIDKDKILLCCVMSCQTSPSSTRTTLQQKKPLPKSIITIL